MFKKILAVLIFAGSIGASAQTTTITAQITDSDGQTWNKMKWKLDFVPNPNYPNLNNYVIIGTGNRINLNTAFQQGTADGTGTFTVTTYDNTLISPAGSTYKFTLCPNASVSCSTSTNIAVFGSTLNLSSSLSSQVTAPRFPATGANSYGYLDVEIFPIPVPGGKYFNVTDQKTHEWNGTAWQIASGSGTLTGLTNDVTASGVGTVPATVHSFNGGTAFGTAAAANTTGGGAGVVTGPTTTVNGHCVTFNNTTGQISDSGAPCGSPAGSTAQLQYNNSGNFAGSAATTDANGNLGLLSTNQQYYVSHLPSGTGTTNIQTMVQNTTYCNGTSKPCTVIADPSYPTTEQVTIATLKAPSQTYFNDLRGGTNVEYYHNWYQGGGNIFGDSTNPAKSINCLVNNPYQLILPTGAHYGCATINVNWGAPGYNLGSTSRGPNGWQLSSGLQINMNVNSQGITQGFTGILTKHGNGDNSTVYIYDNNSGGAVAGSDEGTKALAALTQEESTWPKGSLTSGAGTGTQAIKVNFTQGAGTQGVGRWVMDSTVSPVAGNMTNVTLGSPATYSNITVDTTLPVSVCWGTVSGNIDVPVNYTSPFTTSETFNVTLTSGTCDTTHVMCFVSQVHQCVTPTAVGAPSGGVQSITAPMYTTVITGAYFSQGGMANYGLEVPVFTVNGGFRYLHDIVGSTSTSTMQVMDWAVGVPISPLILSSTTDNYGFVNLANISSTPVSITAYSITSNVVTFTATNTLVAGQFVSLSSFGTSTFFNGLNLKVLAAGLSGSQFEVSLTHANTSATETGTATYVSATYTAAGSTISNFPKRWNLGAIQVAAASDTALNLPCIDVVFTTTTAFNCIEPAISGSHTSTTATATLMESTGTTAMTAFKAWPKAAVLDVQNYTTSPVSVDGTLSLEPNPITFTNGDIIEEPHYISMLANGATFSTNFFNPYTKGSGIVVQASNTGTYNFNGSSNLITVNGPSVNQQQGAGGLEIPPTVLFIQNAYNSIFSTVAGPYQGATAMGIGGTSAQLNDVNYSYTPLLYSGNGGNYNQVWTPFTKTLIVNYPGPTTFSSPGQTFTLSATTLALGTTNITSTGANSFGAASTATTQSPGDNTTKLATTAFVQAALPQIIASSETVTFSATPTFSLTTRYSTITMTANITSFTLASGTAGQEKTLTFCQNATGGFTLAGPANVHGLFTNGTTASKCSSQHFSYDSVAAAWLADSPGVINE